MIVERDIFKSISIGDPCWQYYIDGIPKIGKVFIKGKKVSQYDCELIFGNLFSNEESPMIFFDANEAIRKYISGVSSIKKTIKNSLNEINTVVDKLKSNFESITELSLKDANFNTDTAKLDAVLTEISQKNTDFDLLNNVVLLGFDYDIGDKIFTVVSAAACILLDDDDFAFKIVEDRITSIKINNMTKKKHEVEYISEYVEKHQCCVYKYFVNKIDAINYCRRQTQKIIEQMQTINFETID